MVEVQPDRGVRCATLDARERTIDEEELDVPDKPDDSPELIAALRSILDERGWALTHHDAEQGVYRAEKLGVVPQVEVASATPGALVSAVRTHAEREAMTSIDWTPIGPQVIHGPEGPSEEQEEE